jgi:heme oxygenase
MSTTLAALRAHTLTRHALLDHAMPLAGPNPGLAEVAGHLALLQAWLAPLEAWQAQFDDGPQGAQALPPRCRSAPVAADLKHPCLAAWAATIAQAPAAPCPRWPAHAPAAFRWGVGYVVEGAQLGGLVLRAKLARAGVPHPLTCLGDDGAATAARWRQFLQLLESSVRSPLDVALACHGAASAFDRLIERLPAAQPDASASAPLAA